MGLACRDDRVHERGAGRGGAAMSDAQKRQTTRRRRITRSLAAKICADYLAEMHATAILRRYSICSGTLYKILRGRNVKLRHADPPRRALILDLARYGLSKTEIASRVGVSRQRVSFIINEGSSNG